jgi:histidyl-tRNA synthetase
MRTTFEVVHGNLGAQNSVLGGGRYDGLSESLDSKVPAAGIGFSIGEDRLVMIVEETQPDAVTVPLDLYVIPLGEAAHLRAAVIARDLRRANKSVEVLPEGKLKRGMEIANKLGARSVLIIGEDEMASGEYALKNMLSGEQIKVKVEEIEAKLTA